MINAKVAIALDEEILYDKEGNEVVDESQVPYGKPTK